MTQSSSVRSAWLEAAFVLLTSLVFAATLFLGRWNYQASADSNYHFAVARDMLSQGLRSELEPRLPWTILTELPVDHYFGYHLLLMPFAWLSPNVLGLKLATGFFFCAVPLSLWWLLRKRGVWLAWAWAFVPLLLSNQAWRYLMLRGGHFMAPLSLAFLFVAFFWEERRWRALGIVLLGFVAMLSYQGALLLLPLHAGGLASWWALRRKEVPPSRLLEVAWTSLGLLLGLVLHPYFDGRGSTFRFLWFHVSKMNLDPAGLYDGLREFGPLPLPLLLHNWVFLAVPLVVLAVAIAVVARGLLPRSQQGRRAPWLPARRAPTRDEAVFLGVALVGLVLTARAIRMREYAVPWCVAFVAVVLLGPSGWLRGARDARRRALRHVVVAAFLGVGLLIKWPDVFALLGTHLPSNQYRGAAPLLAEHPNAPVLNIAEADYTTLRFEAPHVRAVWGLNHYFLYAADARIYADLMILRSPSPEGERLQALSRFYQRGVRLVAVQHRGSFWRFAKGRTEVLEPAFERRFPGPVELPGASVFRLRQPVSDWSTRRGPPPGL